LVGNTQFILGPAGEDGEETSVTDANKDTTLFGFNELGQVVSEVLPVYNPNGSGGGSLATYTFAFNDDGDLVAATGPTGHTVSHSYNALDEETSVENADGDTTEYTYDDDNRIGMDENGTRTWTLYDGSDPIMDFNSSGSLEMRYLNGPTGDLVDTVIARESAGRTIAWYLPDRLGTIRDLLNNSGSIIDHVDYSALGTVLDESDPSEGDRMMGFAGTERDTVTGLSGRKRLARFVRKELGSFGIRKRGRFRCGGLNPARNASTAREGLISTSEQRRRLRAAY
jgi:hypothetical protein